MSRFCSLSIHAHLGCSMHGSHRLAQVVRKHRVRDDKIRTTVMFDRLHLNLLRC